MRERLAELVSALVVSILFLLSAAFARSQNPSMPRESGEPTLPVGGAGAGVVTDTVAGRDVYARLGCSRCHSIGGVGNPRAPLDGVGGRRTPEEIRAWTVGSAALQDSLPPAAFRAKQQFATVPPAELNALVAYLAALRPSD